MKGIRNRGIKDQVISDPMFLPNGALPKNVSVINSLVQKLGK
jgi:hypothetical protein